ncbi:MAG: citrulline utilization hydrolase CtlX [Sphingobacteriaceae bacterium]
MQATSTIIMIRPVNFGFNEQTAESNAFQHRDVHAQPVVQENALTEFDSMVKMLRTELIDVIVFDDTPEPNTPDAIFPNNWISFHGDGQVFLYPMQAKNRRNERRIDLIDALKRKYQINKVIDLSYFEQESKFLEGTGSMVLDRENKLAYACNSPRTDQTVLNRFCELAGYQPVVFNTVDEYGKKIYHTNVMMSMGDRFAVICMEAIPDVGEKEILTSSMRKYGKEIVEISYDQMNAFAGNMLQLKNKKGENLLIMSATASMSLNQAQILILEKYSKICSIDVSTIENNGGGSVRCMIAEVYLRPIA